MDDGSGDAVRCTLTIAGSVIDHPSSIILHPGCSSAQRLQQPPQLQRRKFGKSGLHVGDAPLAEDPRRGAADVAATKWTRPTARGPSWRVSRWTDQFVPPRARSPMWSALDRSMVSEGGVVMVTGAKDVSRVAKGHGLRQQGPLYCGAADRGDPPDFPGDHVSDSPSCQTQRFCTGCGVALHAGRPLLLRLRHPDRWAAAHAAPARRRPGHAPARTGSPAPWIVAGLLTVVAVVAVIYAATDRTGRQPPAMAIGADGAHGGTHRRSAGHLEHDAAGAVHPAERPGHQASPRMATPPPSSASRRWRSGRTPTSRPATATSTPATTWR